MAKAQNVAEHSHMVAILVTRICQILTLPPEEYVMHAIFHDAEEAWIGDIATPAKRLMDKSRVPVDKMLGVFAGYYRPSSLLVATVVKLADDVEALRYLNRYAQHKHGRQVAEGIGIRRYETMNLIRRWCLNEDADLLDEEMNAYIDGKGETYADDFI